MTGQQFFLSEPTILKKDISYYLNDILTNFCDKNNLIHEVITEENQFTDDMIGRHINPGQSIKDLWFLADAADILENESAKDKCLKILKRTLSISWDEGFSEIYLYCDQTGTAPKGKVVIQEENSDIINRLRIHWGNKLFWVHSESLYSTLLFYHKNNEPERWD